MNRSGTESMAARLERLAAESDPEERLTFAFDERIAVYERRRDATTDPVERVRAMLLVGWAQLVGGRPEAALETFAQVEAEGPQGSFDPQQVRSLRAAAHLRIGEEQNCIARHGPEACLLPIRGGGVHRVRDGSEAALAVLAKLLTADPGDLGARWLLNLAYMTLGEYPDGVPEAWRIDPQTFTAAGPMPAMPNVAARLGLDVLGLAGGVVVEDLDGDGDLDVMASDWAGRGPLRLFENGGDGAFEETTERAGLRGLVGGLNLLHADYDNDGDADVLVLRGAWLRGDAALQPNSLLQNRGDGTFEDVTEQAGLLSMHPTQTAQWRDFDGDGRLDLFVGNESHPGEIHPCELFVGSPDGTFRDVALEAGVAHIGFVKGVAAGDYDRDGRVDLYLSCHGQRNLLFRNESEPGVLQFRDVGVRAGVSAPRRSFPTWFFDYDNDGHLDLFVAPFPSFDGDHLAGIVADYLGQPSDLPRARLYRGRGDGTFEDVTAATGLSRTMLAMGANFGDVDGDGFLDLYIGTGEPNLASLVPNRMYRNDGGTTFQDVTTAAMVGHLQKGHGIAISDLDDDGDQDVYAVLGGAYQGDVAHNAVFLNPGSGHRWIALELEGVSGNRDAIGARIEVTVPTASGPRSIHRAVNTGGSFGSSSLRQTIGLGAATGPVTVRIDWPAGDTQTLQALALDRAYTIREGAAPRALDRTPIPLDDGERER